VWANGLWACMVGALRTGLQAYSRLRRFCQSLLFELAPKPAAAAAAVEMAAGRPPRPNTYSV
jgi:hypothetical protein